jgi:hypothetical protein
LAKAFDARGGQPADKIDLTRSLPEPSTTMVDTDATPPNADKDHRQEKQMRQAAKQLECVKKADGDNDKLTRCASI